MQSGQYDRQTMIGFVLTGALLLPVFLLTFFLEGNNRDILLREGGVVESASALGYLLCAALIVYKGKLAYLRRYHYLFLMIIFFMLRELDFNKRFTTMGIFTSKFFISNRVPLMEKLIGASVILLLLYAAFLIIRRHSRDIWFGLKNYSAISFGALITVILLVVTTSLDGIHRKLKALGLEISDRAAMNASAIEEILELGIPIILFLTFSAYFKRVKVQQSAPPDGDSSALHCGR